MAEHARLRPDSKSNEGLGKEELERLRALGYIQWGRGFSPAWRRAVMVRPPMRAAQHSPGAR
jgi:hypothetical protein